MSEEERRFSVMLTRSEVETIVLSIEGMSFHGQYRHQPLLDRLERRIQQMDSHEAQERHLADDPEPVNLGGI